MTPRRIRLPDERIWLRVAEPTWNDPLDPTYAGRRGGRWNPPESFATLYLNGDIATARMQIERMLAGSPVRVDDLDDDAYVLVPATLPRKQLCADVVTSDGLQALGLPETYPRYPGGGEVGHEECQAIGERVHALAIRGIWYRSAHAADGRGRELAWFPAARRSVARPVWDEPLPLHEWRYATRWVDLGLNEQPDPRLA